VPVHINLTVHSVERSARFYTAWLGFETDRSFPDGTTFVRDAEGTDLALHAGTVEPAATTSFHFGFRRPTPEDVRDLHGRLVDEGMEIATFDDEPGVVSVKFPDPDGYVVEVYWEPDPPE
jgi:catechol 2,3-dioxygenase-like lactoylglutathione lyase family enzyme